MKNILFIKAAFYRSLILFAFMVSCLDINAQIIYTDIEPDFTSENLNDFYNLDLNNDGISDFTLISNYYDNDGNWLEIYTSSNKIYTSSDSVGGIISVFPWYTHPERLDSGMEIFNFPNEGYNWGEDFVSWSWFSIGYCFEGEAGCNYDWKNSNDKYLGLRILINGQKHYGWARMDVTTETKWVIKDYAYNATPNKPILAGQKVLGLNDLDINKVKVIVSNRQISIVNLPNHTAYNLYAINGQKILHGNLEQAKNKINVQNLTSGLYIIELIDNNSISVTKKKLIIP